MVYVMSWLCCLAFVVGVIIFILVRISKSLSEARWQAKIYRQHQAVEAIRNRRILYGWIRCKRTPTCCNCCKGKGSGKHVYMSWLDITEQPNQTIDEIARKTFDYAALENRRVRVTVELLPEVDGLK